MIQLEKHPGNLEGRCGSIRQIAILLHTLPERTHRVLLGQLGSDDKRRVADELAMLDDVDAMEQYRILKLMRDELQAETSSVEKVESEIQDEIQIGRARVSKKRTASVYPAGGSSVDAASDTITGNTTAGVSSNDSKTLADGVATHPDIANSQSVAPQSDAVTGCPTDSGIDASSPNVSPATDAMQSMFEQFRQTQAAGFLPPAPNLSSPTAAAHSAHDENHILPIRGVSVNHPQSPHGVGKGLHEAEADAVELADRIDLFLTELPPRELCRALGMATTKQAFLVLCGLPNEKAETVLEMLPRRQSRKVRSDMRRMGKLQLSEIDAAKRVIAQIAIRLTTRPESFAA